MNIKRTNARLEGKKRQRLPYVIEWECPECRQRKETDLQDTHLLNPVWGEGYEVPLFCMPCDELEPMKVAEIVPDISVTLK
jgi:hypothetical protein